MAPPSTQECHCATLTLSTQTGSPVLWGPLSPEPSECLLYTVEVKEPVWEACSASSWTPDPADSLPPGLRDPPARLGDGSYAPRGS